MTDLIQCSVIEIIHRDFVLKCLSLSNMLFAYYCQFFNFSCIYNLQGSVATQLRFDKIFNSQFIANCPKSVQVKKFENRLIFGKDMDNQILGHFF